MDKALDGEKIECFVIMPISDQQGYDKDHFQLVYEDIIKPAVSLAGMIPVRADETKGSNLIQLDILRKVIKLPIAICDISAKNPNVFYELGMRQAFDMPTVILKDTNTDAPFDISGLRYCDYNANMKHREVKTAISKLSSMLKETYANRDNTSEVNSLVRLLELSNAAELPSSNLSTQEKETKLLTLKLDRIVESIESLQHQVQNLDNDDTEDFFEAKSRPLTNLRQQLRSQRQSKDFEQSSMFDEDIPF
ncbi:hypothetical protein WMQ30_21905 [Vibrio diabolicus]|uniref:hypothetical protein n=1 Tax=Vibrio diabolicus TaxID=50719 RepID=UPI003748F606